MNVPTVNFLIAGTLSYARIYELGESGLRDETFNRMLRMNMYYRKKDDKR